MVQRKGNKALFIIIITAILVASIFASINYDEKEQETNSINFGEAATSTALNGYYDNCTGLISDIGIGEWEISTPFPELYNWESTTYNSENCLYFGLPTDSATMYSMEASITSPYFILNPSHENYLINFDYFSNVNRELANKITVYSSVDGETYTIVGEVERAYNSNLDNFVSESYEIDNSVRYIRIEVKAYYDNGTDMGVYLKNINIAPNGYLNYTEPTFEVDIDTSTLKYSRQEQMPTYSITSSIDDYPYCVQELVLDTSYNEISSIEMGDYILLVIIYSADNELLDVTEQNFALGKGDIKDIIVDYSASTSGIYINYINAVDSSGEIITADVGEISTTLVDTYPYRISVSITESDKYNSFSESNLNLSVNTNYLIDSGNPYQSYEYDGTAKEIVYTNYSLFESRVEYYKNNKILDSAPINAGSYDAKIYVNEVLIKTISMEISPLEITDISTSEIINNRPYDGTTNAYDYEESDFVFTGVISGDTSLELENLNFASKIGYTYLIFDNATFGGNYILAEDATIQTIYATIEKANVKLEDNIDINDDTILTISDKQYDGTNSASINIVDMAGRYTLATDAPLDFMGVPSNDSLTVDNIDAYYDSIYADNDINVKLYINDLTCFDRFNEQIYTENGTVSGNIITKKIDIDTGLSDISVDNKTYDGTLLATVSIGDVVFDSGIEDADLTVMENNDNYQLNYTSAAYTNADAGTDKEVNISGFVLLSNNPMLSEIINSYEINDLSLTGDIEKVDISILNSYFYVVIGEDIPQIETDPDGITVYKTVYDTQANAELGGNNDLEINNETATDAGTYYIRVEISVIEVNYELENDYEIIVMEIADVQKGQTIAFNIDSAFEHTDDDGIYYNMVIGGKYEPKASSSCNGYDTGLSISYELSQSGTLMTYSQGVYTARAAGTVTITANQLGNSNYSQAEQVSIRIKIISTDIASDVIYNDTIYFGDDIPAVTGDALFNSSAVAGNYIANAGTVVSGSSIYYYTFVPTENYIGTYQNIGVTLYANKAVLYVTIQDIEKEYFTDVNILDYATISIVKGSDVEILDTSEFNDLGISITLISATSITNWVEGSYNVGFENSFENYIEIEEMSDYEINYANSNFNITVVKSDITISVAEFSKFYGQEIIDDEEIINTCILIGNYDTTDLDMILEAITVNNNARNKSIVGRYYIDLSIGDIDSSLSDKYNLYVVDGFMEIVKTQITITANDSGQTYGENVVDTDYSMDGFYIDSDIDYFAQFITLTKDVTSSSVPGNYDIVINFTESSDLYDFVYINGTYTISPAILSGITFSDVDYIYDGLEHSLNIVYDENIWGELTVSYSNSDMIEVGRYSINAIVSKDNYEDLILSAVLTITNLTIKTSSTTNTAQITLLDEDAEGFDPDATLMLAKETDATVIAIYTANLISNDEIVESLVGVYNYYLIINGTREEVSGNAKVQLKLESINSSENIRVLAIIDGQITEIEHTYENGYIVFESSGATEFAIVKETSAYSNDKTSLIIAIAIVIVVIIILYTVFLSERKKDRKRNERSIRKHKRWA
jgi:hypothetical protein